MYNFQGCCGYRYPAAVGGFGCGNEFALIVVLFILVGIVGSA